MEKNKIIPLRSLPRVPQQDGSAENAVGEVKRLIRGGVDRLLACTILNEFRKRASLNWKTATEVELEKCESLTNQDREKFLYACNAAIKVALRA